MTENYSKRMAEYREADFNHRLNMYLQFPGLRSDFIRIDRGDLKTGPIAGFRSRKKMPLVGMAIALSLVSTYAKKILGIASP